MIGCAVDVPFVPTNGDVDTSRAAVKCYVPAYQKEAWRDHADALDMSLSEFVRSMVQAGRRGFGAEPGAEGVPPPATAGDDAAADGGEAVEARVVEALSAGDRLGWEELLAAAVPEDVEDAVEAAVGRLQDDNRVTYRPSEGAFVLADDER